MTTLAELIVKIGLDSGQFEREISGMSGKLRSIGNEMGKIGSSLTRGLTLPIIGAGVATFKMHKDFEFAMQSIVGLVGVSQDQVDKWSKDLLRMGPELGKGPKELAEALYFVTSAGIEASEALDVVEMSAKASAAGLGETKVIADLVTSAMNAYGSENLSAAQATDILVAAVREGKAEASEFAGSLGKVLPIAAELGVEFHEVAAAVAAMTRTGTDANTAGTQLRAIMSSLLKPTKQAEEVLNQMGTSSEELRKKIRDDGLLSALMELRDLTHEYGEEAMAQVFPNIRALIGMLDLMGANIEENVKIFDNLTNATGALDHAFETASQTAEFKWQKVLASMQSLLITVGDAVKKAVIPVMEDFVKTISKVTEWFGRLSPAAQTNIVKFFAYAAALGPILLIGSKLIALFIALVNGVTLFGRAMTLAVGFIKMKVTAMAGLQAVMALMSGPAGWIALAVVAIAAIGYAWWKSSRSAEEALTDMRNKVSAQMMGMTNDIQQEMVKQKEAQIANYKSIEEESLKIFQAMASGRVEIGQEGFELLMENLEGEKEQKLAFLEQQKKEELDAIQAGLNAEIIKTEEEAAELRAKVEQKYSDLAGKVETGYGRINEIINGAIGEERSLTEAEAAEILKIKQDLYDDIITDLENFVVEYKAINALKDLDVNEMTAAQLKEYKRMVGQAHSDMASELQTGAKEALTALEQLLDAGLIGPDEYATEYARIMQTVLDTNIEIAESQKEMNKEINTRYAELYSGVVKVVRALTFDVFGLWEWLYNRLVGGSIIPDMVNEIIDWFNKLGEWASGIWENIKTKAIEIWENIKTAAVEKAQTLYTDVKTKLEDLWKYIQGIPGKALGWGRDILNKLWEGMKSVYSSLKTWFENNVQKLIDKINPWSKHSPSLIENIWSGVKEIEKAYSSIKFPDYDINAIFGAAGDNKSSVENKTFSPNVTMISPEPLSHSQLRQKEEQMLRNMALGMGYM